jgi:hypothetical protein
LQFSCIFPAFPEVLLGNGKFAKKSAKKKVNKLKKHAKKSRFHDSEKYAANPMQKNADEKRKSTPNIKSLQKTNRTCKFISKKCKNHSLSTSQSLPNNFSILKGNTILV